jgi:uncharacterized membrane protein YdbT with pleckstrin-like domain
MTENTSNNARIYFTRLHWIIFLVPALGLSLALMIHTYILPFPEISIFLVVFALLWIAMTWVTYYFSSVTIKRKQIIIRTGILVRQTIDIPLGKIETMDVRQSIFGSILRYGSLIITGTGGTRRVINYINNPLACRRHIEQLMNAPH